MKNPLVGITSDIKGKFYEVESFYFTSLLQSGAIPVMLPMITNRKDIKKNRGRSYFKMEFTRYTYNT